MSSPNADQAWVTRAPAKVNLDLRMLGVREDGYHLVSTVLQSIDLADTLTLRPHDGPFALTCDTPDVPTDTTNLAWRGAAAMASALGMPLTGWILHLDKQVPAEAGLGGGSADAVAAARLVACAAGLEVSPERLADVIGSLGADVAFFAWGGTIRGEGIGDELSAMADVPPALVLIVRPPFGVSTQEAYGWFDAENADSHESRGARSSALADAGLDRRAALPVEQLRRRRPPEHSSPRGGGGAMDRGSAAVRSAKAEREEPGPAQQAPGDEETWRNDLEGPVAARHPEIAAIVRRLRDAGAHHAAMSGSGSACFGLFAPGVDLSVIEVGWPDGTRVWRTQLLSRAEYQSATRCRQTA